MPIRLPPPIEAYFRCENAGDATAAPCFTDDATVRDEGHAHTGTGAIDEWRIAARARYRHTIEPLSVAERDGRTVVKARVSGQFPGSPAELTFSFRLRGGRIAALEIG